MTVEQKKLGCKIVVDAMGGDYAPHNTVKGAILATQLEPSITVYLVGIKDKIVEVLKSEGLYFPDEQIINASEIIEMCDVPTNALKSKKDSSLVVGTTMVKNKEADAFVSAGNTGAMMAASTLIIGRIAGVGRPTMGVPLPSIKGYCHLFDAGASVDCKPNHLVEYAIMGSIFVEEIYNIKNPSIGLLSIGEEDSKGSDVTLKAFNLLQGTNLNFKGNVEGNDILKGTVDVVVCDGFTGNIILKFAESLLGLLKSKIKEFAFKSFTNKIKALIIKNVLKEALKDFDSEAHGGVPLLGVNGISIVGHGSSSPIAIKNMILRAKEMHDKGLILKFEKTLSEYANKQEN